MLNSIKEESMKHPAITIILAATMPLSALLTSSTFAQDFPVKPVRIIVPFVPGGPADLFARELSLGMQSQFHQPVLVENKGGAGGVLGVDSAAKANPDGYTLALGSPSTIAIAPFSQSQMAYDPRKDLAYITGVVKVPEVMTIHPSLPATNLRELIAYMKNNPGKVNFGSAGNGTIAHLAGELLKAEAGVNMVHVPYKGGAPAVADLIAGQIQLVILDTPVLLPQILAGKIRAIAVTSTVRATTLPDVPTTGEGGYGKVNSDNWYGLVSAAAIPPAVLRRINAAAVTTLKTPAIAKSFATVLAVPFPSTPEEFSVFATTEQAKWGAIIKSIGFKE